MIRITYRVIARGHTGLISPPQGNSSSNKTEQVVAKEVAPIVQKIHDPEAFITGLQVPAWIFDQHTLAFLAVNDSAVERYGYSRKQFLRMTILDIRPAEDVPKMLRRAMHPHEKGPSDREPWRHQRKDGKVFDVEITSHELQFHEHNAELVVALPAEKRKAQAARLEVESPKAHSARA